MRYKCSIVACARWETSHIVEWITYNRLIGIDHIYLYCNDDYPDALYSAVLPFILSQDQFVTFYHYPYQGQQYEMYAHALKHHRAETDWILFLDVDEFIRLEAWPDIPHMIDSIGANADSIFLNWLFFGDCGYQVNPPGFVLTNYTLREDRVHNMMTKNITRSSILDPDTFNRRYPRHVWHFLNSIDSFDRLRLTNVLGRDMSDYYFDDGDKVANDYLASPGVFEGLLGSCMVHHYAFKSAEAFRNRTLRGAKGEFFRQVQHVDLSQHSYLNAVFDDTLARRWKSYAGDPDSRRIMSRVKGRLLSHQKPAIQSSVSEWSDEKTVAADASRAVDGDLTNYYKFHTAEEASPWWRVDLLQSSRISAVRLFNRLTMRERANHLAIDVSEDDRSWERVFVRTSSLPFGGIDGDPMVWEPERTIVARYVRIQLTSPGFLHLAQVEVYGEPVSVGAVEPLQVGLV